MTSWATHEKLSQGFRRLCDQINAMPPGTRIEWSAEQLAVEMMHNDWIYGPGIEGFKRALHANVMGSAFGSLVFLPTVKPGHILIEKRECGERTHDRDGNPVPRDENDVFSHYDSRR